MKIELPQVGESVTEGTISQWLKSVGDSIEKYEPLVEVLTDKVNMEMPSPVSGVITAFLVEEGQTVEMGTPIVDIQVEGEVETGALETSPEPVTAAPQAKVAEPEAETFDRTGTLLKNVAPVGPTGSGGPITNTPVEQETAADAPRRRFSPAVLRLADEHNVDLSKVAGTGINGRITRKDVQAYLDSGMAQSTPASSVATAAPPVPAPSENISPEPSPSQDEERVPLTPVRRMIAQNMVKSATEIPTAWSITEIDVTNLVRRRAAIRNEFQQREGVNITYLPFAIKAVAESLKENPLLNASWGGDAIVLKKRINIGIAVAAADGLVVPVIHDADTLSIAGLAKKIDDLTNRARQGKLSLDDVQGGTFTVNNTGTLGSIASQPIINYPQAAIMTTEAIVKRPVILDDAIAIRSIMNICLTFDHRVMDGAEATGFTNAVKKRLETIGPDTGIY